MSSREPFSSARDGEAAYDESVRLYGIEHTHDADCRTWRGQNWAGACDCTLNQRTGATSR
jgi:hypothetical protein